MKNFLKSYWKDNFLKGLEKIAQNLEVKKQEAVVGCSSLWLWRHLQALAGNSWETELKLSCLESTEWPEYGWLPLLLPFTWEGFGVTWGKRPAPEFGKPMLILWTLADQISNIRLGDISTCKWFLVPRCLAVANAECLWLKKCSS